MPNIRSHHHSNEKNERSYIIFTEYIRYYERLYERTRTMGHDTAPGNAHYNYMVNKNTEYTLYVTIWQGT